MNRLPLFLAEPPNREPYHHSPGEVSTPVLEKGVRYLARIIQESYAQWECSRRDGLLQGVDPRIKLLVLVAFLIVVSIKRQFVPQVGIAAMLLVLSLASRVDIIPLYRRILGAAFLFGILVPLPSLLNIFDGAEPFIHLWHLETEHHFWLYHIPKTIGITRGGLSGMALLTLRIANSVALSLLVLHTTSFPNLIKALRIFRVPETFIAVITLSYKYVFAFTRTLEEMHLAKKSRLLGPLDASQSRHWAAGRIAFIFDRTQNRCEEIFKAMISRGYENRVTLHTFNKFKAGDWAKVAASLAVCCGFLLW
jgi:cobalt ECF transporter T component CbiQ